MKLTTHRHLAQSLRMNRAKLSLVICLRGGHDSSSKPETQQPNIPVTLHAINNTECFKYFEFSLLGSVAHPRGGGVAAGLQPLKHPKTEI
jgi:hypothetical protein